MTMTTQEKNAIIGKPAKLYLNGLNFNVQVLDARESYGRTDFKVKPSSGDGEKWVAKDSLKFEQ